MWRAANRAKARRQHRQCRSRSCADTVRLHCVELRSGCMPNVAYTRPLGGQALTICVCHVTAPKIARASSSTLAAQARRNRSCDCVAAGRAASRSIADSPGEGTGHECGIWRHGTGRGAGGRRFLEPGWWRRSPWAGGSTVRSRARESARRARASPPASNRRRSARSARRARAGPGDRGRRISCGAGWADNAHG